MRTRKGKVVLSLLAVGALLGSLGLYAIPQAAEEPIELAVADVRPVGVLSIASYDELKADVAFVGRLTNNPQLATGLEALLNLATKSRGLEGLDKTRPLGVVALTNGDQVAGYACLPVCDFDALMETARVMGATIDELGGGVYRIHTEKKPLYVKQQADWAVASERRVVLNVVPADPGKVLAEVGSDYDVALRLHAGNVPEKYRRELVDKINHDVARDVQRRPGESPQEHALRKQITEELARTIIALVEDVEQVTVGWSLDHQKEQTALEVSVTAAEGSDVAKAAARLEDTTSQFAGFLLKDATLAGYWSGQMPRQKAELLQSVVEAVRREAIRDIEKEPKPEEEIRLAKQLAGDVFDLLADTAASGRVDGALSVLLGRESATLLAGTYVADGARLDKIAKQVAQIAEWENPQVADLIKLDADEVDGIRFHTLSLPIPDDADDRDKAVRLLGETVEVVIGIGKESAYLAAGRDALATLKRAIAASAEQASEQVEPLRFTLAVDLLADFVAVYGEEKDRAGAARLAELLGETSGNDHIHVFAQPIPRGAKYRIEVESDILRALGKLAIDK